MRTYGREVLVQEKVNRGTVCTFCSFAPVILSSWHNERAEYNRHVKYWKGQFGRSVRTRSFIHCRV